MSEFVYLPWKHACEAAAEAAAAPPPGSAGGGTQQALSLAAVQQQAAAAEQRWLAQQIEGYFTDKARAACFSPLEVTPHAHRRGKPRLACVPAFAESGTHHPSRPRLQLLRLTREINKHLAEDSTSDAAQFPVLAGSHLTRKELGTPALAFARSVVSVMQLDAATEGSVSILRKNVLKLLKARRSPPDPRTPRAPGPPRHAPAPRPLTRSPVRPRWQVREFSPEAEFREPCASFTLRDVICAYCNDCRDLDLCRDPALQRGDWSCSVPGCRHPYDRDRIEATLLQHARGRAQGAVLQDLFCRRCRRIKTSHLADKCRCGGFFSFRDPVEKQREQMRVFRSIARFHGFRVLGEVAEWALEEGGGEEEEA